VIANTPPSFPDDREGPVFSEPWEAQAFAIVLSLQEKGVFTWAEWAQYLGVEVQSQDSGDDYYHHWLHALEKLAADKGLTDPTELALRQTEIAANPPNRHGHEARREPVAVA
jgi:nitrile hydratase accessory protein